jgi:mannose-6-phosphate isomerase-like protein (cupin superfamily)
MLVTNRESAPLGMYDGFRTSLLVGETNAHSREISIQITEVAPQKMQVLHSHVQEQCYYIVRGTGLMIIDAEERRVCEGDAVFIPSGASHGIGNIGPGDLVYLTANRSFGIGREKELWPLPASS